MCLGVLQRSVSTQRAGRTVQPTPGAGSVPLEELDRTGDDLAKSQESIGLVRLQAACLLAAEERAARQVDGLSDIIGRDAQNLAQEFQASEVEPQGDRGDERSPGLGKPQHRGSRKPTRSHPDYASTPRPTTPGAKAGTNLGSPLGDACDKGRFGCGQLCWTRGNLLHMEKSTLQLRITQTPPSAVPSPPNLSGLLEPLQQSRLGQLPVRACARQQLVVRAELRDQAS